MRKTSLIAALAAAALGCHEITTGDRPLDFTLSADRTTAAPGEEVEFRAEAEGNVLLGIIFDYGDGTVDSVATSGARRASSVRRHAYQEAGSFRVRARVEEASGAFLADSVLVEILAPDPRR